MKPCKSAVGMRLMRSLTVLALAAGTSLALSQDTPVAEEGGLAAFGRLVPLGYVNRGVRIPSFGANGGISSTLAAETLIRIDDDNMKARKCVVEIAGKRPEEDVRVDLASAVYHMGDRTLRSGERSRVSRSDFRMEGDTLVFDATTSIGRMKGRVQTIIFDTAALSGKSGGGGSSAN